VMEGICARLISETGSALKPVRVARVIRVTMEGLWLDLIMTGDPYPRTECLRTVYCCAMAYFPEHFTEKGLKR